MVDSDLDELVLELFRIETVKFGQFVLKSGQLSPIYFDLRALVSHPRLMQRVAALLWQQRPSDVAFSCVCGVPYTALPLATLISSQQLVPMVIRRKEAKSYGTKRLIEGCFDAGDACLIVEDVIVSGSSVYETAVALREAGLSAGHAVVFVDRQQGGSANLAALGVETRAVCSANQLLAILARHGKITAAQLAEVQRFLATNGETIIRHSSHNEILGGVRALSLGERASLAEHPLVRRLLLIIERKRSNVCVALDVCCAERLLSLADQLGPTVCAVKTHIDILQSFDVSVTQRLRQLADQHDFVLCEDRKFADIGNTTVRQYNSGVHRIVSWADLVTVHAVPGPSVLQALSQCASEISAARGALLIAEMSTAGALTDAQYTQRAVALADTHRDFVCGFVAQSGVTRDPRFLLATPGVSLSSETDSLMQRYCSPEQAVLQRGADIVIVGRAIVDASDPSFACELYRQRAFAALEKRSTSNM